MDIVMKLKYIICLIGATMIATSCTNNFLEYNTNPDEVTNEVANWDNAKNGSFFLQMQENVIPIFEASDYQVIEVMTGDGYAGYFGSPTPHINSAGRYSWSNNSNWPGAMFTRAYQDVMNPWRELKKAINNENDPRYAVAQILKVATMHRVTDSYGPIPYLKFGIEKEVPYDTQKDVYYRFFEELDAAVKVLDSYATNGDKVFPDWDCVYQGNTKSWVKFANTLRFRLAMHISDVDKDKAKAEILAAMEAPYGFVENKEDVPELQHIHPIATYESPWYIIRGWGDIAMGATIDSYMNGYEDPRRSIYFDATSDGKYCGIRAGLPANVNKKAYISENICLLSQPNVTATSNVVWMRAAEIFFLKAEAVLRWPELETELGGTVQDFYENGIRKSFEELGASGAEAYLANEELKPARYVDPVTSSYSISPSSTVTIKWINTDNTTKKLERIITQKYIALYPVGQEAWTDFRRTGYPKVFPVIVNESLGGCVSTSTQIRRLPYPRSEYDTNLKAVEEGVKLLGGPDNAGTRVWWD